MGLSSRWRRTTTWRSRLIASGWGHPLTGVHDFKSPGSFKPKTKQKPPEKIQNNFHSVLKHVKLDLKVQGLCLMNIGRWDISDAIIAFIQKNIVKENHKKTDILVWFWAKWYVNGRFSDINLWDNCSTMRRATINYMRLHMNRTYWDAMIMFKIYKKTAKIQYLA